MLPTQCVHIDKLKTQIGQRVKFLTAKDLGGQALLAHFEICSTIFKEFLQPTDLLIPIDSLSFSTDVNLNSRLLISYNMII